MNKLIALSSLISLVGCTNATSSTTTGSAATSEPAAAADAQTPEQALAAKLEPYITCSNDFSNDVFQSRRNYLSDVDPKKGPSGHEEQKIYLMEIHDPKACTDGIAAAAKLEPHLPDLEAAGAAYATAITALYPLLAEGHAYYDHENNRDDKGAKGRALHGKLLPAWAAFGTALDGLDPALDKYDDQLTEARLAKLATQPEQRLRYLHARLMADAKKLVTVAGATDKPANLPLAPFTTAVGAYDKALGELLAYTKAHAKEIDDDPAMMSMSSLTRDADDLLKSSKSLMRRKRDKVAYSDGEAMTIDAHNPEAVDGSPGQVVARYNSLIGHSNSLRW